MNVRRRRPSWWQLWLLFPVLGILAFLEASASLSPAGHIAVEVGIVLIIFGLVSVWLRANQVDMLREMREARTVTGLPLESGAIAARNGNGHKRGGILAGRLPETEAVSDDREVDR